MTELRSLITPAFKGQLFELTVGFELFLEIYQYFQTIEDIEELYQEFHNALYYYVLNPNGYFDFSVILVLALPHVLSTIFLLFDHLIKEVAVYLK